MADKERRNHALFSMVAPFLICFNASLLGFYAYLTGAYWVGVPGLFNAPLTIITLVLLHRASQELKSRELKEPLVMQVV